ncbi:hypothetical protein [Bacillus cereus group sp. MYBK242-2]
MFKVSGGTLLKRKHCGLQLISSQVVVHLLDQVIPAIGWRQ